MSALAALGSAAPCAERVPPACGTWRSAWRRAAHHPARAARYPALGGRIQQMFESCLRVLKPGGVRSSLGVYSGSSRCHSRLLPASATTGSWPRRRRRQGTDAPADHAIAFDRADLRSLVTHPLKLDQIEEAYDLSANQRDGVLKVAITPEPAPWGAGASGPPDSCHRCSMGPQLCSICGRRIESGQLLLPVQSGQRRSVTDQDGRRAVGEDMAGHAAEHQLAQAGAAVAAHDQEVGTSLARGSRSAAPTARPRGHRLRVQAMPRHSRYWTKSRSASASVRHVAALRTWTDRRPPETERRPTARAASALSFHATATEWPTVGAPCGGTIRSGRPAPNSVASRTAANSGGVCSSGRQSTVRSLARAFFGITTSRLPVFDPARRGRATRLVARSRCRTCHRRHRMSSSGRTPPIHLGRGRLSELVDHRRDTPSPITGIASRGSIRTNRPLTWAPKRRATPNAASRLLASLASPNTGTRVIRMLMTLIPL